MIRHLTLGLILLTLLATCLAAAAKLRATPKYDRVQVGMSAQEAASIFGHTFMGGSYQGIGPWRQDEDYDCDEGLVVFDIIVVDSVGTDGRLVLESTVANKWITRRGPLERLAWLAGWR